jgi:hypothetical integral membrane protein (TIGR02206 family)
MRHIAIPLLSYMWFWGVAASASFILLAVFGFRAIPERFRSSTLRWLGIVIVGEIIATHGYLTVIQRTWALADSLPLHVCRISVIFAALALIRQRGWLYEWSAYIGVPGGFYSIITPELTQGNAPWMLFDYYFSHSCLLIAPILLTQIGCRPTSRSVLRTLGMVNLMALLVFPLNYLLRSNYMYLAARPIASNPLIIGPWPWYIIGLEIALLIHLFLMDLCFRVLPRNRGRTAVGTRHLQGIPRL